MEYEDIFKPYDQFMAVKRVPEPDIQMCLCPRISLMIILWVLTTWFMSQGARNLSRWDLKCWTLEDPIMHMLGITVIKAGRSMRAIVIITVRLFGTTIGESHHIGMCRGIRMVIMTGGGDLR